jgi:hypothetical protein
MSLVTSYAADRGWADTWDLLQDFSGARLPAWMDVRLVTGVATPAPTRLPPAAEIVARAREAMAGARSLVTQGEIVTVLDNQVSTVSGFTLEWSESGDLRTTAGGSEGDESIDLRYVNGTGYLKSTAFRRFAQRDTWNVLASDDVTVEVMAGFRPESLIPRYASCTPRYPLRARTWA